nr:gliding motility lipoprotein GldB [Bacteroidota bacterium]
MQKIIIITLFLGLFACNKKIECESAPNVSNFPVDIDIKRLEQEMFEITDINSAINFIKLHKGVSENFLQLSDYPTDTILAKQIMKLINDPDIKKLYEEVLYEFGDKQKLEKDFEQAFKFAKHYYPQFQTPEVTTMVTGLGNDLYISDSLIVVGLDFFIGPNASYKPIDLPQYILNRYR